MSFVVGLADADMAVVAMTSRIVYSPTRWAAGNFQTQILSDGEPFAVWDHVARAPRFVPAFPRNVRAVRGGWLVGSTVGAAFERVADACADVDAADVDRLAGLVRDTMEEYAAAVPDATVAQWIRGEASSFVSVTTPT